MASVLIIGDLHYMTTQTRSRKDNYHVSLQTKISTILNDKVDVVIFLGDVYDSPLISKLKENAFQKFLRPYLDRGIKFYTIVGNHDILSMNYKSIMRTSLCSANLSNTIKIINKPLKIDGITYVPTKYEYPLEVPLPESENSVLLAHAFLGGNLDTLNRIDIDDLKTKNFKYAFLGHDHFPKNPVKVGNTTVYRPGSVMRISVAENRNKSFYYLIEDGKPPILKSIKLKDYEDTFYEEYINRGKKKRDLDDLKIDLESLTDYFNSNSMDETESKHKMSLMEYLDSVNADKRIKEFLQIKINNYQRKNA